MTAAGWLSGMDAGMFRALEGALLVFLVGFLFFVLNIYNERGR
jgi:hypothetical protein